MDTGRAGQKIRALSRKPTGVRGTVYRRSFIHSFLFILEIEIH
jgi:hypothetical protein